MNLATQYMQKGYDPQAFIARLAEIVCHDNFTEMHAFKHHQPFVEEYKRRASRGGGCIWCAAHRQRQSRSARTWRCTSSIWTCFTPRNSK